MAVSRLSQALALRLGVRLDSQGQLCGHEPPPAASVGGSLLGRGRAGDGVPYRRVPAEPSPAPAPAEEEEAIFLPAPRRPSICQQLMRYFLSY